MSKSNFPKTIYVGIDGDNEESFFVAVRDYEDLCVPDDKRKVAIYALVRVAALVNKSEIV